MNRGKASDDKKREKVEKGEKVSKGVKSRRMTGMKMKELCTTRVVKEQRDANIAVENIESAS